MNGLHSADAGNELTKELRDLNAFQAFMASLVQEEGERRIAELVASALISLFGVPLGLVALRSEEVEGGWEFYGQMAGTPLDGQTIEDLREVLSRTELPPGQGSKTVPGGNLPTSLRRRDLQALHVLPVRTLERHLGSLLVGSSASGPLHRPKGALLDALATHLAMVLENARLRRAQRDYSLRLEDTVRQRTAELQRKEREQNALLEINRAVSAHLERGELFHAIADAVRSVVTFDRIAILLPRPEEDVLLLYVFEGQKDPPHWRAGATFPRAGSLPGWVLEHKRPFVGSGLEDLRPFPVSLSVVAKEGMQSHCVLPLLAKDRAVGVLVFLSKERGLYDSVNLPFLGEMAAAVAVALDKCLAYEEIKKLKDQLNRENIYLREEIKSEHDFEEIVGNSPAIKKVLRNVERVAATDATVLLTGETGTGKELIARAIHHLSRRGNRLLVNVNCAALPASLIESELFGHERGAFTGAISRKIGRFELADGGSIFLDEIGDLPPELQAKFLRVLQEGEFERVGGSRTLKVNVRVIAATNLNLEKAVQEGDFRSDLYYRLNVFPIHVPALRERKEDIPLLVRYFAMKYGAKLGKRIEAIPQKAMDALQAYNWPGNIRELENVIDRAVILTQGSRLELGEWLPRPELATRQKQVPTLEELERSHIIEVLELTGWRVSGERGAAKLLGMKPTTLEARMKKLEIRREN